MPHFRFSDGIEVKSQSNLYKRLDVFLCRQEGHRAFDCQVSVYHVLKEKRCYPHGCLSFRWKCLRLNKGLSCSRGFRHVGRLCFGCKFFVDEKISHRPKVVLPAESFEAFQRDLREFESWLEEFRGREVNYSGTVFSVKPHLTIDPFRKRWPSFRGFLVVFKEGFVNMVHLKDFCYLRVSGRVQEKYRFRRGDRLDFFARFSENRGRIVLVRVNRVEIEHRAEGFWWNENRARVALGTGAILKGQPERCFNCEKGCLIDVNQSRGIDTGVHRRLFCLEGVRDPGLYPYVKIEEEMRAACGMFEYTPAEKDGLTTRPNVLMSQRNL